jgi:farnesyl diphosphate synthase
LDLTQPPRGDLSAFTLDNYKKIVKYKTAFYSFYLPVALAMLMAGISLFYHLSSLSSKKTFDSKYISSKPAFDAAKEILLPMGEYFQVQVGGGNKMQ